MPVFSIKPFFVLGYMRSGTTLIFKILGNHPEVFTLKGEPKVIEYLSIARQYFPDLSDDKTLWDFIGFVANVLRFGHTLAYFGKPLEESPDFKTQDVNNILAGLTAREYIPVFRSVQDYFARSAGKSTWCIKAQVLEAETVLENFPDALFVEIIRDPRDVLASKKNDRDAVWHSERYRPEQRAEKDLYNTYDPLWDVLSWRAEIRAGRKLQEKYPARFFSIRYEDLVAEPEIYIKKLCAFAGLSYHEAMLEINERNSSVWDKKYKGIGAESVRKWQAKLTPAEIALAQWATKAEMQRLDYDMFPVRLGDQLKVPFVLAASLVEFLQRLVKRYRLGGWAYLWNVLSLYWKKWSKAR